LRYWVIHLTTNNSTSGWYTGDGSLTPDPVKAFRFGDPHAAEQHAEDLRNKPSAEHVDVLEFLAEDSIDLP
jgi:hypothetical protein